MIIEKLNKKDIEQYKYLMDECFGSSNSIDQYKANYDEFSNSYEVIVAKDNDKIVGSITLYKIELFTYSFQPALEIFNVAVLKEYRGRKIAKEIFNYIINYAKEHNYKSIYLTCLDTAYDAHHLYESVGFKKASSIKFVLNI
jgi:predicted N-acetyltransferase YhbS